VLLIELAQLRRALESEILSFDPLIVYPDRGGRAPEACLGAVMGDAETGLRIQTSGSDPGGKIGGT
jgi:hypothetical protein